MNYTQPSPHTATTAKDYPYHYLKAAPRKDTGIHAEPSFITIPISPINPDGQPRDDTGNEALGRA